MNSFWGVSPPISCQPIARSNGGTVIINADPHSESGSHRLAVHFIHKSSSAYYFDSYGLLPLVPDIQNFKRCNRTVWDYNGRQLQGLTSNVCCKYCCLFALYTDMGNTPNQFVGLFEDGAAVADRQIDRTFAYEFGS